MPTPTFTLERLSYRHACEEAQDALKTLFETADAELPATPANIKKLATAFAAFRVVGAGAHCADLLDGEFGQAAADAFWNERERLVSRLPAEEDRGHARRASYQAVALKAFVKVWKQFSKED